MNFNQHEEWHRHELLVLQGRRRQSRSAELRHQEGGTEGRHLDWILNDRRISQEEGSSRQGMDSNGMDTMATGQVAF